MMMKSKCKRVYKDFMASQIKRASKPPSSPPPRMCVVSYE